MKIATRALTLAEYRAKAALLDMWYGDRANVFVERDETGPNKTYYDADTGEEISRDEVRRRIKLWEKETGSRLPFTERVRNYDL